MYTDDKGPHLLLMSEHDLWERHAQGTPSLGGKWQRHPEHVANAGVRPEPSPEALEGLFEE